MTLAELIFSLLNSQEASGFVDLGKIFSMRLVLSDNEEINGAQIIEDASSEGDYVISLSDGILIEDNEEEHHFVIRVEPPSDLSETK